MKIRILKRLRAPVAALTVSVVVASATLVLSVAPAHAAASGRLLTSGVSSAYSNALTVNLSVPAGGTYKKFYYKVVNTSPTAESFKIVVNPLSGSVVAKLYKGYSAVPNTYQTPPIASGGSLVLNLRVSLPAGVPHGGDFYTWVTLRDPGTNALLDEKFAGASVSAPAVGTTAHDLFIKTGSQAYVGGSHSQYISAAPIKLGGTAKFSLRLKNDGTIGAAAIGLKNDPPTSCAGAMSVTVKEGYKDVTASVQAGTYSTGILQPGRYKNLSVQVKVLSAHGCKDSYMQLTASGPSGAISSHAHIPFAV